MVVNWGPKGMRTIFLRSEGGFAEPFLGFTEVEKSFRAWLGLF